MNLTENISFESELRTLFIKDLKHSFFAAWFFTGEKESRNIDTLASSIKRVGLLNPLIVITKNNQSPEYILISGYKRAAALKSAGVGACICRVIKADLSEKDILELFIQDNAAHRTFSRMEISSFLNYFSAFVNENEIIEKYLPLFGLNPSKEEYQKYLSFAKLGNEEKEMLEAGIITEKTAQTLLQMDIECRTYLAALFKNIRPSASHQRIMIELLSEISLSEGIAFTEVLGSSKTISNFISDIKISPQQKAAKVKEYLETKRYPAFTEKENEFSRVIKSMKLPGNIKITHPEYFESELFSLEAKFKNSDDLNKIAEEIKTAADKFRFKI